MKIKATIVPFQQGTEEWMQHRARSLNASDLAAAMGLSPYLSRADLIKRIATGIVPEVDAATQRRFDKGHEVEALARPLAEELIGEELYCSVFAAEVEGLYLSASLDGHTLLNEENWEHKQANAELIASLRAGVIPEQYHPQMEQGQMLDGATRTLFTASNGTRESAVHVWYESRPELRAQIIPTWKQLMADAAAYVPTAAEVKPTGKAPETLPALHIVLKGEVSASNLDEFKEVALSAIRSVNRDLQTDQDFADSAKARKWCEDIESKVDAAKQHALSQTASIDMLFRALDEISEEAATVRKELKKLEDARRLGINGEVVADGVKQFADHIRALNAAMPASYMPVVPADFGGAIKGLRTVASKKNAVATELARVKIVSNEIATRIQTNIGLLDAANAPMLFADISTLVLKQPDDLAAVIAQRLAAEAQRKEVERERIRAEEAARLEREAEAARKVQEAAEEMTRKREQEEADRIAREQSDAVKARVDLANTAIAALMTKASTPLTSAEIEEAESDRGMTGINPLTPQQAATRILAARLPEVKPADDGAHLTLGEINARIAPVSIAVAGLSVLGFEPVAVVKSARLYRACDFPAMCAAISAHVLAAPVKALEAA